MTDLVKHYDWTELLRTKIMCRIECPKCKQTNVIEGDNNPFYWNAQMKQPVQTMQCDRCRGFITLKIHKGGVEVIA